MSTWRKLRSQPACLGRPGTQAGQAATSSSLPYAQAEALVDRLIEAAARLDEDAGASLGALCGAATVTPALGGTVIGILARNCVLLGAEIERDATARER